MMSHGLADVYFNSKLANYTKKLRTYPVCMRNAQINIACPRNVDVLPAANCCSGQGLFLLPEVFRFCSMDNEEYPDRSTAASSPVLSPYEKPRLAHPPQLSVESGECFFDDSCWPGIRNNGSS